MAAVRVTSVEGARADLGFFARGSVSQSMYAVYVSGLSAWGQLWFHVLTHKLLLEIFSCLAESLFRRPLDFGVLSDFGEVRHLRHVLGRLVLIDICRVSRGGSIHG